MGMLANVFRPRASWSPMDDRWYAPELGITTDTGVAFSAETVMRSAAVLAAVRFKAESVAMCKAKVVEYLPDGSRRPAPLHYAQLVLRDPNAWQTGFEWTHFNVVCLCLYGNAFNRIIPGPTSFVERLEPLHPSCVTIIGATSDGGTLYEYRSPTGGATERLSQSEVLHYSGLSLDGRAGTKIFRLIRNVVGIALAIEKHATTFLRKGTRVSGILSTDQKLTQDVKNAARESWNASFSLGSEQAGGVAVLGDNLKFTPMAGSNREAQLIELDGDTTAKILMSLGVPGVVVGWQGDKTSTYASADAFFEKGGIKHCIQPVVMNFEERDRKSLLLRDDRFAVKRDLDILMRSNLKDRYAAEYQACGGPFMTRNEIRNIEDLNRMEEADMDRVLMPVNLAPTTDAAPVDQTPPPPPPPRPAPAQSDARGATSDDFEARAWQFAHDAAARVVRRELAMLAGMNGHGLAVRYASKPEEFRASVAAYYEKHARFVAESLRIPLVVAQGYCRQQSEALARDGVACTATWESDVVPSLAALAMGERLCMSA